MSGHHQRVFDKQERERGQMPLVLWKATMSTSLAELAGEVLKLTEVVMEMERRLSTLESNREMRPK